MKQFLVYWYHLDVHSDPYSQGYVGVTMQAQKAIRHRCHINGISGGSKILNQAFKKYGEGNVLRDVLHTVPNKEAAYALEQTYRPQPNTGWNIAIGGGLPPDCTGRKDSPETRLKRNLSVRRAKAGKSYPSMFKGLTDRHSPEKRALIGNAHRGKVISEAHRQAISDKISGKDSPKAKEIFMVHKDDPSKLYHYPCVRVAADALGIGYNTLRGQAQRVFKTGESSESSRRGWIILTELDAQDPITSIKTSIAKRQVRMMKMATDREANRKAQKVLE
jgi:hypothetical protein